MTDERQPSKYALKRMAKMKAGGIPDGTHCPPAHVINREAQAYLRKEGKHV